MAARSPPPTDPIDAQRILVKIKKQVKYGILKQENEALTPPLPVLSSSSTFTASTKTDFLKN